MMREPVPEAAELERLTSAFRLLSDPGRFRLVIALLEDRELPVTELAGLASLSITAVSQQLRVLRDAGVVRRRRDGRHVYYRLAGGDERALARNARPPCHRTPTTHAKEGPDSDVHHRRALHRREGQVVRRCLSRRLHPRVRADARDRPRRSASTAAPASRNARSRRSSPRTPSPTSGSRSSRSTTPSRKAPTPSTSSSPPASNRHRRRRSPATASEATRPALRKPRRRGDSRKHRRWNQHRRPDRRRRLADRAAMEGATLLLAAVAYLFYVLADHSQVGEVVTRLILVIAFALWAIVQLAPAFSGAALLSDLTVISASPTSPSCSHQHDKHRSVAAVLHSNTREPAPTCG